MEEDGAVTNTLFPERDCSMRWFLAYLVLNRMQRRDLKPFSVLFENSPR
jgi:hypothetical protein